MGHHISAILLRGAYERELVSTFDLRPLHLVTDIALFPLQPEYCDYWSEKLGISGFKSERPILNCNVIHHMMQEISQEPLFAVIETNYMGGMGDQAAAVYRGDTVVMEPTVASIGPINKALRSLGVCSKLNLDEFDVAGLGKYRDFDDLYEEYCDKQ